MQAKQVPTVRPESRARPPHLQAIKNLQVSGYAVAVDRIEKQNVAFGRKPAIAVQQFRFGGREECFACCDLAGIVRCQRRQRIEIERIAEVLNPPQTVRGECARNVHAVSVHRINR
jgi:hypothetical protein